MASNQRLRIGSRGSQLARWQANWTADRLRALGVDADVLIIRTRGDVEQSGPVQALGVQGAFTKEIQQALLNNEVDLAVHSLKDLPTAETPGLCLAVVPEREEPADALASPRYGSLEELPKNALVGTGSVRRQAQLKALRSDLHVQGVRGNVDTRLRKLDDGEFDALVLAAAGLRRLGMGDRIAQLLAPPWMLPAPGQGALAIECRTDDTATRELLAPLEHRATRLAVIAERTVLKVLHGGCSAPVATWGRLEEGALALDALVATPDGTLVLRAAARDATLVAAELAVASAVALGQKVADDLLAQGAAAIVHR